ncbi:unnamed protein product [Vicia faba]|uniref:Haloacid dehalogenase-like hydrolase (HAD) superfamily protein n=1 Tax=Vicia faba TaxID=3906 RepID=A0AAV0ZSX7_VICFA|nr:unnamed protein product [Vicia faba]
MGNFKIAYVVIVKNHVYKFTIALRLAYIIFRTVVLFHQDVVRVLKAPLHPPTTAASRFPSIFPFRFSRPHHRRHRRFIHRRQRHPVSHQFSPFDFPGHTTAVIAASSTDDSGIPSQDLAVLLEVDGVLVDAYRGNRIAFNKAFEKLGLDCASWSEPVYSDLLRCFFGYLLLYYFLACAYVLMEKVDTLLLLSQQDERHLLERNVNSALQIKTEELKRNLLQCYKAASLGTTVAELKIETLGRTAAELQIEKTTVFVLE